MAETAFSDVSSNYWAAQFIQQLLELGVIAGFLDGSFRPEEPVTYPLQEKLIKAECSPQCLADPNVKFLNPTATATRAQIAAFIYQALVSSNQVSAINSPYVVSNLSN